ncbi:unnamed protein product [Orchesella dallaii]|uniref:Uncharacterized protein n=1 Tax=Orchesella dallaii TaxID=48710 RepID=A0ABP1SAJ4_9HEXA
MPPNRNYSALDLGRREIESHTASRAHKVRHELHRKSQSSFLIGAKLLKNSTSTLILGESTNFSTEDNLGKSRSNSASSINTTESSSTASAIIIRKDETFVRRNAEILHQNESHNKANKYFPSITDRLQKKQRETRALSVTQVPTVSAPIIHRHTACHGQPEGLNHHSSYKKDLLDQRKTTKEKQGAKTSANKRVGASWPYLVTTRTTSPTTATVGAESSTSSMVTQSKFTFAVRKEKVEANEIEELTKRQEEESIMATRPSLGIMTGSGDAALHSSKLTSISSSSSGKKNTISSERMKGRQKRNAEMNVDNSDSTLQSDPFGNSQSSAFTSKKERKSEKGSDSLDEPYFFPVSSSSAVSSSASFLQASSPHNMAILSPSASSHDQWYENNENGSRNNNGNSSVSGIQKRLYVYGQGCGVKLIEWVDHVSGIMFILGFCIIGFVKTCFLVILRTEIREMIEKIHMIEPEEVLSPSRTHSTKEPRFHHVSHPLLQNPHRASTVSAHGVLLPTIKSPDGPSTSGITSGIGGYNRQNRHYLRRASNIVGGDRSRSHSNETVNMTLLMTTPHGETNREKGRSNPNLASAGGSSGTIANTEERDPVSGLSIPVPNSNSAATCTTTAPRYLRRSSTCSSSANPVGYPYGYGFDGEPRAGPSSRFYQYFEPVYQPSHHYQQHHHHHYTRNRPHARNMSCGAILPLTSYRSNSAAAAATALASYRGVRTFNTATSNTVSAGASFSSNSKDENEMIISVSLEHIASSDQDEEAIEEEKEQEKKDWAAACTADNFDQTKSGLAKFEEDGATKMQTFTVSESVNETTAIGNGERELQRRNGNNNVDLTNTLPMSYIGTAV